jgi:hypothetical protein
VQYWQHFTPMTVGQIIDRTFTLYRNNFLRFITIVALVYVPVALISIVVMVSFVMSWSEQMEALQQPGSHAEEFSAGAFVQIMVLLYAAVIFVQLGQELCKAALTKGVSDSYLGIEPTVGQAVKTLLRRGGFVLIAFVLLGIVFLAGLALCIVPGLIFMVFWMIWLSLTTQIIVVENLGPLAAMSRSKQLVSGNAGKVFVLAFLLWLLTMLVSGLLGQVGQLVGRLVFPDSQVEQVIVGQLSGTIGQILAMPIVSIAMVLLYYDLRIRKEGFDLQMLSQTLGTQGMPADGQPPVQY